MVGPVWLSLPYSFCLFQIYVCGFLFQQSYTVLREEDIKQRQEDDIIRVATVLSISMVDASILLRHYSW